MLYIISVLIIFSSEHLIGHIQGSYAANYTLSQHWLWHSLSNHCWTHLCWHGVSTEPYCSQSILKAYQECTGHYSNITKITIFYLLMITNQTERVYLIAFKLFCLLLPFLTTGMGTERKVSIMQQKSSDSHRRVPSRTWTYTVASELVTIAWCIHCLTTSIGQLLHVHATESFLWDYQETEQRRKMYVLLQQPCTQLENMIWIQCSMSFLVMVPLTSADAGLPSISDRHVCKHSPNFFMMSRTTNIVQENYILY